MINIPATLIDVKMKFWDKRFKFSFASFPQQLALLQIIYSFEPFLDAPAFIKAPFNLSVHLSFLINV